MEELEDVDDILQFHDVAEILQARRHGRERHIIRQRVDLLEEFTAQEFLKRFRLSKDCVASLLDELRQYLPTSIDRRGVSLRLSARPTTAPAPLRTGQGTTITPDPRYSAHAYHRAGTVREARMPLFIWWHYHQCHHPPPLSSIIAARGAA
ncbi:hypothetical protein GWK47_013731 [Chionoecetes opilio]|uniref:Uncharacterized protein n=1 Tax=Chionoecetes opilio TaxID=41210 RepID=A0A8J4Y4A5_CHIOP|nr:hypothetical protein GWK47_013731 [Chionoecetes opilio]